MTSDRRQTMAVLLAAMVVLSVTGVVVGFSEPARAATSIGQQTDIASHADSTSQSVEMTFDLPPQTITCTLDVSQMQQYGVTVESVSASGSDKFSIQLTDTGEIEFTIQQGQGTDTVRVVLTVSTEAIQIPEEGTQLQNQANCGGSVTGQAAADSIAHAVDPVPTQQSGFTIEETGIQNSTATAVQSDDRTLTNDSTLNQSVSVSVVGDGDTYNVTVDTREARAAGINITGASLEADPSGSDGLVELVGSPTVTEDENVTLTIREAAGDRADGNLSRETLTVALDLDATRHDAGTFQVDDSISHVIRDEAGNTTAIATFQTESAAGTANLSVTDYSVSSTNVTTGETVTVEATVQNTGDASGSTTLTFYADGTSFAIRTVMVDAGNTTTASAMTSFSSAGTHNVSVNDLHATEVTVQETSLVDQYDTDGDGLETTELLTAIDDFRNGAITVQELLDLIDAWRGS